MAIVNPDVPQEQAKDYNYLGYSRGISQPEANKSLGLAIAGAGNLIEQGVKVADFAVKSKIEDQIYKKAEAERGEFTSQLETIRADVKGDPLNVLPAEAEIPADLAELDTNLSTLVGARRAGKVPTSMYWGRLAALAKEMRNQYPGYREYIDHKFSSITGHNPANAYMISLLSEIGQTQAATADKEQARIYTQLTDLNKDGNPSALSALNRFLKSGDKAAAYRDINEMNAQKWQNTKEKDDLAVRKSRNEAVADDAQKVFTNQGNTLVSNIFSDIAKNAGANLGVGNIEELAQRSLRGELPVNSQQAIAIKQSMQAHRNQLISMLTKLSNEKMDDKGNTLSTMINDSDKVKKSIEQSLYYFDQISNSIAEGNIPLATKSAAMVKATTSDNVYGFYTKGGAVSSYFQLLGALEQIAPGSEISKQAVIDLMYKNTYGNPEAAAFFNLLNLSASTQTPINWNKKAAWPELDPRSIPTPNSANPPVTLKKDALEPLQASGMINPKLARDFVNISDRILDPRIDDRVKRNQAVAAFHPNNFGLVSMFPEDYKRPDGTIVPGKYAVFSMMTTPAIAKEVNRLGATYPELRDMYRNFVNTTFASELWPKEVAALNSMQATPGIELGWDGSRFYVGKTAVKYDSMDYRTRPDSVALAYERAQDQIGKLNMGLNSVATMAKEMNQDMESYMIGLLKSSGVEFKNVKSPNASLPEKMGAAIINFRSNPTPTSGTPGANKRMGEAPTGSGTPSTDWGTPSFAAPGRTKIAQNLPEWLSNPAGTSAIPPGQNITDRVIIGEDISQIPPGVSPADYIKSLNK